MHLQKYQLMIQAGQLLLNPLAVQQATFAEVQL